MKKTLEFRVDTMGLLTEIADSALRRGDGVLRFPLNAFRIHLGRVAARAAELDDPQLNICMLNLALYEVPVNKVYTEIQKQRRRIKKQPKSTKP